MHALFVANYIIEYSNKKGYKINNLKLQKLLYFVNVRNILENGAPLFEESMEKWKYGPVVPDVYHEYKRFGAFSISKLVTLISILFYLICLSYDYIIQNNLYNVNRLYKKICSFKIIF